ncbi:MAG: undecaprenyldiphospho-muramoylpentapeptide beta-N-acetylglucosaminyltransferase [Firmicutes bacterium]|nr:undecaprenyldiphospho-muramoylpentapeptide beta-N-acetylglucosaminyltransferase [Bacillota bacterium]
MRIIVVAGGTGGHIYPALAIINKIKEKEENSEVLYIGTSDRMEKDIVPKLGIRFIGLEMKGLNRKNIFKNVSVMFKTFKSYKKAKTIIKEFNPDIVVGAGGYVTAPVLYAAHKLGYKTLVHEQNSIPGMSNKFLSSFVDTICLSFPKSKKYFKEGKTVFTGNPRSEEINNVSIYSRSELGFKRSSKLVVFVMGSLGSTTITNKLKEMIPSFKDKNYQVLIITGKAYYDSFNDVSVPSNVKLVPFLDNLINLMKDTDLLVSRAGASTISEITAIGLPTILVPSPYVTHNHQYLNAKDLEDVGACQIVEEKDFDSDKLIPVIDKIVSDKKLYKSMSDNSFKFGVRDSATRIYEEIRKLIGE